MWLFQWEPIQKHYIGISLKIIYTPYFLYNGHIMHHSHKMRQWSDEDFSPTTWQPALAPTSCVSVESDAEHPTNLANVLIHNFQPAGYFYCNAIAYYSLDIWKEVCVVSFSYEGLYLWLANI